jgi:sporulation protein YtfJ
MSQTLPNMLENTVAKIREMVDVNSVIGNPITTPDGVTIIPISTVSVGFGGGGSDFVSKNVNKHENPFGGGAGGGVKITPVAFLIVKDGNVRMMPVAAPANTTADRIVEQVPDLLDKLAGFIDSRSEKKNEKKTEEENKDE